MKAKESKAGIDWLKWGVVLVLLVGGYVLNSYYSQQPLSLRLIGWLVLLAVASFVALKTRSGKKLGKFTGESRVELRKVVWPTRKETLQTTLMVIVMVILVALVLWAVDSVSFWGIGWITGQRG